MWHVSENLLVSFKKRYNELIFYLCSGACKIFNKNVLQKVRFEK